MTKEEMLEKYKNLIYKVIKDTHCNCTNDEEFQEYYDAGMLGLIYAINHYNSNKERTTTYFLNCIKHGILRQFYYKSRLIRKINYIEKDSLDDVDCERKCLHELIPDETINIEADLIKKEQYEIMYKAIEMLKPQYKDIICKYYGIKCNRLTLEQISQIYKISRQAINVKRDNALRDLRKYMKRLGGLDIE